MIPDDYQPTGPLSTGQEDAIPGKPFERTDIGSETQYVGKKLLDRYEIFKQPNQEGGFGIVYFVTDLETNQDYAVKTYKPEIAHHLDVERFKAEIDFWLNLEPYPHIVKAYFVEVIDNQPYLFMEYVDGGAKTNLVEWRKMETGGRFSTDQAIHFAYQLCLGMEFANRKGEIVHGDLKPQNILIDRNRILKVTDFGTAELIQVVDGKYPISGRSTWEYAPPELILEQVADSRSDIFSLGIILCEMLMGEKKYSSGTMKYPYPFILSNDREKMYKQLSAFHEQHSIRKLNQDIYYHGIPGFQEEISFIVSGCLSDDMSDRFRDFTMLRKEIERTFNLKPPVENNQASTDDLHRHALSLHKIGRYHEALNLYNRLLLQRPDDAQILLDAAETLRAVGLEDDAQRFRERAFSHNPQLMKGV